MNNDLEIGDMVVTNFATAVGSIYKNVSDAQIIYHYEVVFNDKFKHYHGKYCYFYRKELKKLNSNLSKILYEK